MAEPLFTMRNTSRAEVRLVPHDVRDEALEGGDPVLVSQRPDSVARCTSHAEVGPGPTSLILVLDVHRSAGAGRQRRMAAPPHANRAAPDRYVAFLAGTPPEAFLDGAIDRGD